MKFEEEFPSLKDKVWLSTEFIEIENVQEFCLDKQRVREAIEEIINHGNSRELLIRAYLFKELGL